MVTMNPNEIKNLIRKEIDNSIKSHKVDQLKWIAMNGTPEQSDKAIERLIGIMTREIVNENDSEDGILNRSFEAMKALSHVYGIDDITSRKSLNEFARRFDG